MLTYIDIMYWLLLDSFSSVFYYVGKDHTIQIKWNFKCHLLRALKNFDLPPAISPELNKCPGSNPVQ